MLKTAFEEMLRRDAMELITFVVGMGLPRLVTKRVGTINCTPKKGVETAAAALADKKAFVASINHCATISENKLAKNPSRKTNELSRGMAKAEMDMAGICAVASQVMALTPPIAK